MASVSRGTIMNAIKKGRLDGKRFNDGWQIPLEAVEAWMADRHGSAMPKTDEEKIALDKRVAVLEAELRGRDQLIDQLRQDLDHARRPWWEKMLGRGTTHSV